MSKLRTLAAIFGGTRLYLLRRSADEPRNPRTPDSRWPALLGLLIALLLVLSGIFLVRVLGRAARLQDCVMSGRTNCAPIDTGSAGGQ